MRSTFAIIAFAVISTGLFFTGCKKSSKSPVTSDSAAHRSFTATMGGTRTWHRSHYYYASGLHYPTPVNESWFYPDTSFAISVISDTSLNFLGTVYSLETTDSSKQMIFFGTAWNYYQYNMGTGVIYYFAKDSILFCSGDLHSTSDYWKRQDLTYTY